MATHRTTIAPARRPAKPSIKPGKVAKPARRPRPPRQSAFGRQVAGLRKARRGWSGTRPSGYVLLLACVVVLTVVGLVMVLSASSVESLRTKGSAWFFFERQAVWVGAGTLAACLAASIDYRFWARVSVAILALAFAMLVVVLIPGVGINVNGASRWIGRGQLRIQPSEFAKLSLLLFSAVHLARRGDAMRDPRLSTRPVLVVLAVMLGLMMLQPDMGTTLVTGCIVFAVMFVAGTPLLRIAKLLAGGSAAAFVLGVVEPYRRDRLLAFLHPWRDPLGIGYHVIQGRVALAEGGVFGVGIGASRAKWGFLPNGHTDFIFAIIANETGLVGGLTVVALFVAFGVLGVRAALRAPDRLGALLAAGITAWVVGQAFINIGAVVGILPVTGVPLPFVSFGGSSLVVLLFAVGILLNVARQGRE